MPWPWLAQQLVILAVSVAISYALRPKISKKDFGQKGEKTPDVPTCEQGTIFPVIFGRPPRTKANMVLWYGGFRKRRIVVHDVTLGFWYYLGIHYGLSHAHVDGVKQLWFDDRCFWPVDNDGTEYQNDSATTITVDKTAAWGGYTAGGGLRLRGLIYYGDDAQVQDDTLKAYQDGDDTPAYRGITSIVFDPRTIWGKSNRLPIMEVVLKRTALHHDGSQMWYILKSKVDTYDSLNIIHVIRECLTSTEFGRGISTDFIDSTTFEAAADTCYTENLGICYRFIPGEEEIGEFISILENIMNGFLYFDHSAGTYKIKLIREDYDAGALTTYDEDDFELVTFSRESIFNVPSETIIEYSDMDSARAAKVKEDDLAIQDMQGSVVSQTFRWPMIVNPTTAATLAAREQQFASSLPAKIVIEAKRTMYALQRGDVIKVSHARLTEAGVSTITCRVVTINRGELEDGILTISLIEEMFGSAVTARSTNPQGVTTPGSATVISGTTENIAFDAGTISVAIINEAVT